MARVATIVPQRAAPRALEVGIIALSLHCNIDCLLAATLISVIVSDDVATRTCSRHYER
jgi:hypothetical protein